MRKVSLNIFGSRQFKRQWRLQRSYGSRLPDMTREFPVTLVFQNQSNLESKAWPISC